jgi:stage II sporulation protein D
MAVAGQTYHEILAFYFPGVEELHWSRFASDHVVIYAHDVQSARQVIAASETAWRQAESVSMWPLPDSVSIYVYPTLDAFRTLTAEPGWVAAKTFGRRIDLQPPSVLQSRGVLVSTLRHEFVHVIIEDHAAPGVPIWFREGIVEWLTAAVEGAPAEPVGSVRERSDQSAARAAYRSAAARVRDLIRRYGSAAVLSWVERGIPAEVTNSINKEDATKSR